MFYKDLARELYRVMREVERLEGELASARTLDEEDKAKEGLRTARAELRQLRSVLDGAKER